MADDLVDLEAERSALAAIWEEGRILGAETALRTLEELAFQPDDFTDSVHRGCFVVMQANLRRGRALVDGVMGEESLKGLLPILRAQEQVSRAQLATLAEAIRELAIRRQAWTSARNLMRAAADRAVSVSQLHGRFGAAARELSTRGAHWEPHDVAVDEAMARIDRNNAEGAVPLAVATGYPLLDEVTGGYPPNLTVVFGQPGVAKTGFVLSTARNVAQRGEVPAIFAMEDGKASVAFRWLAHAAQISGFTLKYRRLENEHWHALANAETEVKGWSAKVLLDGRPGLRPGEILMASHEAVRRHRARLIVLDNMTAVRFTRGPRMDLEIQDFLTDLRALATTEDVAVVVVAHAKRREGLKPGAIPLLTDCRESAAFEILARLAIGIGQDPLRTSCITDGPMDERCPDGPHLDLGILKNTDGHPSVRIALPFRPASAMLEDPRRW